MELLTQSPGEHKCLTYCAAMILGIAPELIEEMLNIDSNEVVWKDLPRPDCYRGVHIQEIQGVFFACGKGLCLIEINPYLGPDELHNIKVWDHGNHYTINRIHNRLHNHTAIIIEHAHATVYHNGKIYDPNGKIFEISGDYVARKVREIWVVANL